MPVSQISEFDSKRVRWSIDRLFDAAKKDTVIRLRWPLVILSSYLLYYTPSTWLTPLQVQAILILYLLSHSTLYFLADEFFDSPYFYGTLLIFDTLVLTAVVSTSGTASPDFYVACLITLFLSCICNDTRGLLAVTFLAPLIYGYFVFYTAADFHSGIYLRLPFPFVISLFYGYFAQVERIRRAGREKAQRAEREQTAAEEIRRQRERLEVLYHTNLAMTSTLDPLKRLDSFLETALIHLPYAAGFVRLKNRATGTMETTAALGLKSEAQVGGEDPWAFADRVLGKTGPFSVSNVVADAGKEDWTFLKREGLRSFVALPLMVKESALGCLVFLMREERRFEQEEVEFLSALASQLAIAIHHAELYNDSRRRSADLLGAQRVKDEFLRLVSSQLKAPLSVIAGYAEMFLDGSLGEMTPIQEKAMQTMARQSKNLQGLINGLLQASDIETEPLQAERHELNLWEFLSDLRSGYDEPLAKDVKFVWDYPADLPSVSVDRRKLKQILEGLIDNAIKFTDRGAVTIAARYASAKEVLEFEIADTGPGIPPEQMPVIFEKFRQGRSSEPDSPQGGVGLGLYIVKKYVDLLGGTIRVASRAGQGSRFTVTIPVVVEPRRSDGDELLPASGG